MRRNASIVGVVILALCLAAPAAGADDASALAELIDRHVQARLDREKLQSAPPADDAEFVRRVFLDLHGVVPTARQAARFLDDADPDKRVRLIDELLADPRFGEHQADLWRGRLISPLVSEQRLQTQRFADWLARRFNDNDGWDQIASDLLTASGKLEENPAVSYLIEGRNPLGVTDLTDLTSRYFLGVRLNCAQCHDHPFVEWKQRDYWGMAAFFSQIQTPGRPKQVYQAGVRDDAKLTLATLSGADMIEGIQVVAPTFLGGTELTDGNKTPHRAALARWLTAADNPYFARAMVNRMWWHFFGQGIVSPVDDMHAANPPSHPELLDALTRHFADAGFDLKLLCRAIARSRTYQRTSRPGEQADQDPRLLARMPVKVLSAEQLFDSLVAVTGPPAKTPGLDARFGARHEFCQFFAADGDRNPLEYQRGIPHLLRLMNSPQFSRNLPGLVSRTTTNRAPDEAVEELFLTILCRRPTAAERELVREQIISSDTPPAGVYRDLAWALLLGSEFSLNH
jgi:hypothetical protein